MLDHHTGRTQEVTGELSDYGQPVERGLYRTAIDNHGRTWIETAHDEFEYESKFGMHTLSLQGVENTYGPVNICDGVNCSSPSLHRAKPEPGAEDLPVWVRDNEGDEWDLRDDGLYELRKGGLICTRERIRSIHGIQHESQLNRYGRVIASSVDPFGPEDAYDHVSDMCERLTVEVRTLTNERNFWRDRTRDQAKKKQAANDGILKARSVIVRVRDAVGLPRSASDDDIVDAVEASNLARLRRELREVNARANRAERDLAARVLVEPDQEQANQISHLESRAETLSDTAACWQERAHKAERERDRLECLADKLERVWAERNEYKRHAERSDELLIRNADLQGQLDALRRHHDALIKRVNQVASPDGGDDQ